MTSASLLAELVGEEHAAFVDLVVGLDEAEWQSASLCEGWTIAAVAGHVAQHIHHEPTSRDRLESLHQANWSPARAAARDAQRWNSVPPDAIVDRLAQPLNLGGILGRAFDARIQLAELVIHQQDVRRPLGLGRAIPPATLTLLLVSSQSRVGSATVASARRRCRGLRLVATDVDWAHGTGPELRGPAEALLMAASGRSAALHDLSGDGVAVLAGQLPSPG